MKKVKKKVIAVILTGGSGTRIAASSGCKIPKQFVDVLGKPLFIYCIDTYLKIREIDKVYLIVNKKYIRLYRRVLKRYNLLGKVNLVSGGRTRLLSIQNAMKNVEPHGIVVLQNGVCPTTPSALIRKCVLRAMRKKAVTAYIPAFFTNFLLKNEKINKVLDRKQVGYTCDPQVYEIAILKKALRYAQKRRIMDAPTVELLMKVKVPVYLESSKDDNLKVTTEADLKRIEYILRGRLNAKK